MSRHIVMPADGPDGARPVVDTEGACLVHHTTAALIDGVGDGTVIGLELEGRVNEKRHRHTQLYVLDAEGAAAVVAEITAVYSRAGRELAEAFTRALDTALEAQS